MTISRITAKTRPPPINYMQTEQQQCLSACMAQQLEKFPSLSHTSLLFFKVNWFVDFIANRQRLSPGGGVARRKRFSSSTSRGSMVKVDRNSGRFNVPELKVSKSNRTLRYSCSPIHLEQVSIRHHICARRHRAVRPCYILVGRDFLKFTHNQFSCVYVCE